MKRLVLIICLIVLLFSCEAKGTERVCECMESYQVTFDQEDQIEETSSCLKDLNVQLTLDNTETSELIKNLESDCPIGARKLWKLCGDLDDNLIKPVNH